MQSIHGAYTHERRLASGRLFLPDRLRRNHVDKLLHLLLLTRGQLAHPTQRLQ